MAEKFRLDGKSAVVTGGASGIGLAIAQAFAGAGAVVHVVDLNQAAAEAAVATIEEAGGKAFAHGCNVADQAQVEEVLGGIVSSGRLDILVNNAGIAGIGTVVTATGEDMDRVYSVNVKSVYHCTKAVIEAMVESGGGVILNMASIAASCGLSDRFTYSMSKGAVLAMTYSIARDYLKKGIRCNAISPARVHTAFVDGYLAKNYAGREEEMFKVLSAAQPIGRMGLPSEVADLALFLCSDEAGFLTGVDYSLDGGFNQLR